MEQSEKIAAKLNGGREYRNMKLAVRSADQDAGADQAQQMIVEGYATTFNEQYTLYDGRYYKIVEQIDPHAFDECDMSDVIMQYDHEGRVYARTKNNTLTLATDSTGLKVTADLGGTELGRQLYDEIRNGYTDKMSFGFIVGEDKREETTDHVNDVTTVLRTITKITKLYDVSAVSLPANDATSISARKYSDGVIEGIKAERLERANHIRRINLKLFGV